MIFVFTIIDGKKFRRLKPIRYGLYFVLITLGFIINEPKMRYRKHFDYHSIAQLLGINAFLIWALIIIVGIFTLLLYLYSKNYGHLGNIEISDCNIKITQGKETKLYNLRDISNLIIERGSTWHYNYRKDNYLLKIDNWIKFTEKNNNTVIEFAILTMEENSNFENLIILLNKNGINFKYSSI